MSQQSQQPSTTLDPFTFPGMDMWLFDVNGNKIQFAQVYTVSEARELWCNIAGESAGQTLQYFEVRDGGRVVYTGNYVTDEC